MVCTQVFLPVEQYFFDRINRMCRMDRGREGLVFYKINKMSRIKPLSILLILLILSKKIVTTLTHPTL